MYQMYTSFHGSIETSIAVGYTCIHEIASIRKSIRKLGQQLKQLYQDVHSLDSNSQQQEKEQVTQSNECVSDDFVKESQESVSIEVGLSTGNGNNTAEGVTTGIESGTDVHAGASGEDIPENTSEPYADKDQPPSDVTTEFQAPEAQLGFRVDMGTVAELQSKISVIKADIHECTIKLTAAMHSSDYSVVQTRYCICIYLL